MCILCEFPDHLRATHRVLSERQGMRALIFAGNTIPPEDIERTRLDFAAIAGELGITAHALMFALEGDR
jgi:hypothetical protein